jgi:L-threonylcarbamoyladenylate synthase
MTNIVHLSNSPEDDEPVLKKAADLIRRGGLVAFPTETVYGLGANALDKAAVNRIFVAKGRPPNNPVIVHIDRAASALLVAATWPDTAELLARKFWPGPLTLVLPKKPAVPDIVTAGASTVAIRVPAHPVALRLLQLAAVPIAAPSANRSGQLSPTTADHVAQALGGRIDMILDGGPTQVGLESTVLSLANSPPRLLRPGHITPAQIEAVIGPILRVYPAAVDQATPLPSPGLLLRHYAPRTRTEVVEGSGRHHVLELARSGLRVGWLTLEKPSEPLQGVRVSHMPAEPQSYAVRLYAALHDLDRAGLDRIVVDLPPETDDWLAVRDRLRRAAAQD